MKPTFIHRLQQKSSQWIHICMDPLERSYRQRFFRSQVIHGLHWKCFIFTHLTLNISIQTSISVTWPSDALQPPLTRFCSPPCPIVVHLPYSVVIPQHSFAVFHFDISCSNTTPLATEDQDDWTWSSLQSPLCKLATISRTCLLAWADFNCYQSLHPRLSSAFSRCQFKSSLA